MTGKWHTIKAHKIEDSLDHIESEFREQGVYVSLTREPPQNSTDNPIEEESRVKMCYNFYKISLSDDERKKYLPNNPWRDHITCDDNETLMGYDGDLADNLSSDTEIVVIEDYNTTGLVGDVNLLLPDVNKKTGEYEKSTDENTFYWFLRSNGSSLRRTKGRGGSNALGKLAFPLASKVRTFWVVTTREDGSRYLCGQSVVRTHYFRNSHHEGWMYYGEPDLISENRYGWTPIKNQEFINEFCSTFKVNRPIDKPGTSIVVLMPLDEITEQKVGYGILANYFVPILDKHLEVDIKTYDGKLTSFNAANVRKYLKQKKLTWEGITKKINNKPNPAWSTLNRMQELEKLYDAKQGTGDVVEFEIGTPPVDINKKPSSDESFNKVLPEKGSDQLKEMTDAFNRGKYLKLTGRIPQKNKHGSNTEGIYSLVIHKTEEDRAEAHFYRDKISLPLVNNKQPVAPGVSSLFIVEGGNENPLAAFLRDTEGPAHLRWNKYDKNNKNFHHVASTVSFIKNLASKLVTRMTSMSSEKEAIWNSIFSQGKRKQNIAHYFDIEELPAGGVVISPPPDGIKDEHGNEIDIRGMELVARIGYPKPFGKNPSKPPDRRAIDTHEMNWTAEGADISFDVVAGNGELCYDRVRIKITNQEFRITLLGTNTELKAQVRLNEVVN